MIGPEILSIGSRKWEAIQDSTFAPPPCDGPQMNNFMLPAVDNVRIYLPISSKYC